MTYNRLEAKPIVGEHCRFCGAEFVPLVKTLCCEQLICCDTAYVSKGGEYCQKEHESYSLCYFHYNEKHEGIWQECEECRELFDEDQFEEELNFKPI